MPSPEEIADFVRRHTALVSPPACPELQLHLAKAISPLWQASETLFAGDAVERPYWAFAWAGGQGLARHLIENKWLVRGRKVLDFMAGSGIAGIAAAKAGAAGVTAYDSDAMARAAIGLNGRTNHVTVGVRAEAIDPADAPKWEVVLVGDIGYEPPLADLYMPQLRAMAAKGALVLVADPGRVYAGQKGFVHLGDYTIPTSSDPADTGVREAAIYRLADRG